MKKPYEKALQCLTPRERRVIELRLGIDGDQHQLADVALQLRLSAAAAQCLLEHALRKLRWRCAALRPVPMPAAKPSELRAGPRKKVLVIPKSTAYGSKGRTAAAHGYRKSLDRR